MLYPSKSHVETLSPRGWKSRSPRGSPVIRVEQDDVSLPKSLEEDINPSCPLSLAHNTLPLQVIQLQDAALGVEGALIRPQAIRGTFVLNCLPLSRAVRNKFLFFL